MEEKVVIMALKVDLECSRCYKKVKKVLSKFPQIRDQIYNEKQNTVMIKVVCCKPEKIRDKICCKSGGSIKSIEIKEPEKPKAEPEKKKEPEKQKAAEPEKKKEPEKQKAAEPAEKKKEPEVVKVMAAVQGYPPAGYPFRGGPGYYGYEMSAAAPCYVGRPIYDSYGGGRGYYGNHCDYFNQENNTECTVM